MVVMAEKSKAIPFLDAPANLEGLPGYKGTILKNRYEVNYF